MACYHIHIKGQVQGVGFRPFIYKLAKKLSIHGTVANGTDGVHIVLSAVDNLQCQRFMDDIIKFAPTPSRIISMDVEEMGHINFDDFSIIQSSTQEQRIVQVCPDIGICECCKAELFDRTNRRHYYPFITCTHCGPRVSIIHDIPYDRPLTTMSAFEMCPSCLHEFNDPDDRRYYSQTNSCHTCGVNMSLSPDSSVSDVDAVSKVVYSLQHGNIVAVKGVGGYLLLCDATNEDAVTKLRMRKRRPLKPFAIMYPDIETIKADVLIGKEGENECQTAAFPIVLCYRNKAIHSSVKNEVIAPNLSTLGIMLPNSPLLCLISYLFGKPLVATSANISGSPIIYEESGAQSALSGIADLILHNNRQIVMPQDDSVIRFSPFYHQRIILRRSRGLAPTFWPVTSNYIKPMICTGADMKSCFALGFGTNIYLSQYLGNLSTYESQMEYQKVLNHYIQITHLTPEIIIRDTHPQYFSSSILTEGMKGVATFKVQHHKAHFCACLYENQLLHSNEPIMGIIWDGIGYGEDGQMWGGEFFVLNEGKIDRVHHVAYFDYLLGDKMSVQPRISALSICKNIDQAQDILNPKFNRQEWNLYKKLITRPDNLKTSSIGRVFDGIASLLGLADINSYEGQAAMILEDVAYEFFRTKNLDWNDYYPMDAYISDQISMDAIVGHIVEDIKIGIPVGQISAKFHITLIRIIEKVAHQHNIKKLVFSGGVFQNALLVDLIIHHLSFEFDIYFHKEVSPNDECIALGQLAYYISMGKNEQEI
jgi:hydrogenase maturation protein HypF